MSSREVPKRVCTTRYLGCHCKLKLRFLTKCETSHGFFMSSLYPQSNSPPYFHKQLSGTSIALVCIFFLCFIGIVYLSAKAPRPAATRVHPSSTVSRLAAQRRRPRLLEVWLDKHLDDDGTVHNWRVSRSLHAKSSDTEPSPSTRRTHTNLSPRQSFCPT